MKPEKYWPYLLVGAIALVATYFILKAKGLLPGSAALGISDTTALDLKTPFMRGESVRKLQNELVRLYAEGKIQNNPGTADGIYGPMTKAAHDEAMNIFAISGRCLNCFLAKVTA